MVINTKTNILINKLFSRIVRSEFISIFLTLQQFFLDTIPRLKPRNYHIMKNSATIGIKWLLTGTLVGILIIYYIFLTPEAILKIVKEEYIFLAITLVLVCIFTYYKIKLKDFTLISYIPNINYVDIKTTLVFFIIFQAVDFYYEEGFIGMISQWFIYWVFAVIAWLVTNNINFYKNYQFYKYETISNKKL